MAKRLFDLTITLVGLVLIAPLLLMIAVIVRIKLGSPVIFRQQRPGLHGKTFVIYKFRTMTDKLDDEGNLLSDAERLTGFGKFLRSSSLDELPELFNVLKGEMSLVGPRPLLMRYLPYYTERERLRFTVLPGITGWAQINGRNEVTWDRRLAYDSWYVENRSFRLDLKILFLTFFRVLGSKGVVVDARSIMLNLDEERCERKTKGL
jgi:lipopolysaccharide/colanic/teichoic acid biosynthesis glycosyltransferase